MVDLHGLQAWSRAVCQGMQGGVDEASNLVVGFVVQVDGHLFKDGVGWLAGENDARSCDPYNLLLTSVVVNRQNSFQDLVKGSIFSKLGLIRLKVLRTIKLNADLLRVVIGNVSEGSDGGCPEDLRQVLSLNVLPDLFQRSPGTGVTQSLQVDCLLLFSS